MEPSLFQQRHSRALRLWHWLTALTTLLILFTVFINKSFLNWYGGGTIIDHSAAQTGTQLSRDQVSFILGNLRDTVWKWHIYYGYVLSLLLLFRCILEFFQKKEERFYFKISNGRKLYRKGTGRKDIFHFIVVRWMYLLFYVLIFIIAGTGLYLSFNRNPSNADRSFHHSIHEIHENGLGFFLLFLFIHTAGVIIAERGRHKNIVSGMIHGKNITAQQLPLLPDDAPVHQMK